MESLIAAVLMATFITALVYAIIRFGSGTGM